MFCTAYEENHLALIPVVQPQQYNQHIRDLERR